MMTSCPIDTSRLQRLVIYRREDQGELREKDPDESQEEHAFGCLGVRLRPEQMRSEEPPTILQLRGAR